MKIAVPTREGNVDDHFGHCDYYTIFSIEEGKIAGEEIMKSPEGCGCKSGVAPLLAEKGVVYMLAGNMGMGALNVLNYHGIQVYRGCSGEVRQVVEAFLTGGVKDSGESCHSHENCH